jgi:hypothetical protein
MHLLVFEGVGRGVTGFRIHIVGCAPRAGTTLLKELVSGSFETSSLAPHEVSVLVRPRRLRGVCVSKHPHEVVPAGRLLRVDPRLWVIYCLRDPRDVVCSRHPNDPSQYVVGFEIWSRYDTVARRTSHPRFMTVKYEDLVMDPDSVQTFLSAAMPFLVPRRLFSETLSFAQTSEASRRAMHNAHRIHQGSVGVWRQNLPRIREQLERFPEMKHELIARGYETGHEWVRILDGIESEPCLEKERGTRKAWYSRRRRQRMWLAIKYLVKMELDRATSRDELGAAHIGSLPR